MLQNVLISEDRLNLGPKMENPGTAIAVERFHDDVAIPFRETPGSARARG